MSLRVSRTLSSLSIVSSLRWAQLDAPPPRAAPRTMGGDGVTGRRRGGRLGMPSGRRQLRLWSGSEGASPAERPSGAAATRDAMSRKARRAALGSRSTAPTARPVSTRPRGMTPALTTSIPASKPGARRLSSCRTRSAPTAFARGPIQAGRQLRHRARQLLAATRDPSDGARIAGGPSTGRSSSAAGPACGPACGWPTCLHGLVRARTGRARAARRGRRRSRPRAG